MDLLFLFWGVHFWMGIFFYYYFVIMTYFWDCWRKNVGEGWEWDFGWGWGYGDGGMGRI